MKDKLAIIGAGGHGKVIADIAKLNGYKEIVFLDDNNSKKQLGNYSIVGTSEDILKFKKDYDFFVAIGNNEIRKQKFEILLSKNVIPVNLIHPSAVIDSTVKLENGIAVMANVVINADSKISKGVIINTAATVDHDCFIGEFTHICPSVNIAGTVNVGKMCMLGIGSSVINNVNICDNVLIGAGGVVISDIIVSGKFVGAPINRIGGIK